MPQGADSGRRLPLPRWLLVLLAPPTFFMPLAYAVLAVWVIGCMLIWGFGELPKWLLGVGIAAIGVTFAMWPVYIVWVLACPDLTRREKVRWLLLMVLLNMFAMPAFYLFIVRRRLGIEVRRSARDEGAAQSLLASWGVERGSLTERQWGLLVEHSRRVRLARWSVVPMLLLAGLLVYVDVWYVPRGIMSSAPAPTRVVIVDAQTRERTEVAPDPAHERSYAILLMCAGVSAAVGALMATLLVSSVVRRAFGWWPDRRFLDVLHESALAQQAARARLP